MRLTAHLHAFFAALTVPLLAVLRDQPAAPRAPADRLDLALPLFVGGLLFVLLGLLLGDLAGWPRRLPVAVTGGGRVAGALLLFGAMLALAGYLFWGLRWRRGAASDRARRPDVRWRAAAVTVGGIAAIGVAVSGLPRLDLSSLSKATTPTVGGTASSVKHAEQAIGQEVAQRFQQGVAMLHARQYEFAIKAFHRVLELDPMIPEAHVNMGFALLGQGDFAAAQRFFEGAAALNKNQVNAYYGMGLALEGLRNPGAAAGALRTYLHLAAPDDPYREQARVKLQALDRAFRDERRQRGETVPEDNTP